MHDHCLPTATSNHYYACVNGHNGLEIRDWGQVSVKGLSLGQWGFPPSP